MLQVALSQLRLHARRFVAVGLAVILAVAFLAATLMVNATTQASLGASMGESYAKADVVVAPAEGSSLTPTTADALASSADVAASFAQLKTGATVSTGSTATSGTSSMTGILQNVTTDPSLAGLKLDSGRAPSAPGEITLDANTAKKLGVTTGAKLTLAAASASGSAQASAEATATGAAAEPATAKTAAGPAAATAAGAPTSSGPPETAVTLVGISTPSHDPYLSGSPQLYASTQQVSALLGGKLQYSMIQLKLKPGVSAGSALPELAKTVSDTGGNATVRTADQQTTAAVQHLSGGHDVLTIVLLAFAAIAVLVSALVIANTFAVLVAQRVRELALLRCLGAGRGQVRNSVLLEALVVGVVASLLGLALAVGVMAALVGWAKTNPESQFATLAVPPSALLIGFAAGVLMTLLAALVPARGATRVAPLAALRPVDGASVRSRRGLVRLILGALVLAVGMVLLIMGADRNELLVALPGGVLSFLGLLLGSTLFIPGLVSGVGKVAAPLGVPGKLASLNAVRNPGRTTATATALLIGVTLVSMMMTGAATARSSFDNTLDRKFPVDAAVTGPHTSGQALSAADVAAARAVPGITAAALVQPAGILQASGASNGGAAAGAGGAAGSLGGTAYALDGAAVGLIRDKSVKLDNSSILMPKGTKATTVTVKGQASQKDFRVVQMDADGFPPSISAEAAQLLGGMPAAASTAPAVGSVPSAGARDGSRRGTEAVSVASGGASLWLSVDVHLSSQQQLDLRTSLAKALNVHEYQVDGAAIERATFNQIIDVLLLVVTALLAVAVLIALIGVANTLSLSVLERTRESSLLRALGLTKGQLRGMLAIEAVLIAGVAALSGAVLGVFYGWAGAKSALGVMGTVAPAVPWLQLLAVLAVAIVAGLLASVLPARRAARLSPVAGLATE